MTPSFNGAIRVELSGHPNTSDSGALLLREALDNSGVMPALEEYLVIHEIRSAFANRWTVRFAL